MRKENIGKSNKAIVKGNMTSYHMETSYTGNRESYAFSGFNKNKYFTSDRTIALNENFEREDGKPLKGYGLEIETGWNYSNTSSDTTAKRIVANIVQTNIYSLFPNDLFKMQNDCTITGVEMITQVMTKEFIRNNYANFKTMWNEIFPMFAMTTNDGNCGMHVNVSIGHFGKDEKTQAEAVRKLYYIINKHYDLFKEAFYRKGSCSYCARMPISNVKEMDVHRMSSSHGNCFNGSHFDAGRVEIRLVGGQKDFACFRNTMETVFHIVERVKTLKWSEVDDLTAIFKGCNSYVYDRLSTNCRNAGLITDNQLLAIKETVESVRYL